MDTNEPRIRAGDAIDRVEIAFGGRANAKATLAELLRDDKIEARADLVFVSGIGDLQRVWTDWPKDGLHVADDLDIAFENWNDSIRWADDVSMWDWPDGRFFVTTMTKPLVRNYFDGISFYLADIKAIEAGRRLEQKIPGRGGRRPDFQRWQNFWMAVVEIARDGKLQSGQVQSQEALRDDILAIMDGDPFSEDTIKEPVRRIWERFCA